MIRCPDCGSPWEPANGEPCPGCQLSWDDVREAARFLDEQRDRAVLRAHGISTSGLRSAAGRLKNP